MSIPIIAFIVDDEKNSITTLSKLLEKYAPQVEIAGSAQTVENAIIEIDNLHPELVFLDINLPDGDGFEVIENTIYKDYSVIFTTAFDSYALKAFEYSALHYLLKPIRGNDLAAAIERFENSKPTNLQTTALDLNNEINNLTNNRLILPSSNGLLVIQTSEIIRCESSNNYTTFFMLSGEQILVSRSINSYEQILNNSGFVRVHNKHLINLKFIKRYIKGRGGYIIMANDMNVDVSEGKKKEFLQRLNSYAGGFYL